MEKIKRRINQVKILIKTAFYYIFCTVFKPKRYSQTWLISERGTDARDNGFAFYRYMKKYHKEVPVKYIISKSSVDRNKIEDKSDIIEFGSKEHYIAMLTSKNLISTHTMGYTPDHGLFCKLDRKGMVKLKGKRIFLQHGIIKDDIEAFHNINVDIFVTAANPEYKFIKENFGIKDGAVKGIGLARYDYLEATKKKFILVMPTWRRYLYYMNMEEFKESSYFKAWNEFINDEKMIKTLEENDFKLIFYPHYEMQKFIDAFQTKSERVIIATFNNYDVPKLLCECNMLVTDYSSVAFDIAYMDKPVLYYQFDFDVFEKGHYQKGYFDYKINGFGPVQIEKNKAIEDVDRYIENDFELEQRYKDNKQGFFIFQDKNNSERTFNCIRELENE